MAIDFVDFTGRGLAGGALIGVSAALLILGAGRILGAVAFSPARSRRAAPRLIGASGGCWAWSRAPALAHALMGTPAPVFAAGARDARGFAGLLVGFGARLGSRLHSAVTASAALRGCRRVRWSRRALSWRSGFATVFARSSRACTETGELDHAQCGFFDRRPPVSASASAFPACTSPTRCSASWISAARGTPRSLSSWPAPSRSRCPLSLSSGEEAD